MAAENGTQNGGEKRKLDEEGDGATTKYIRGGGQKDV